MITGKQSKAARALIGLTQKQLASKAGLSFFTVRIFESGFQKISENSTASIQAALEDSGIIFLPENPRFGLGVRLKA